LEALEKLTSKKSESEAFSAAWCQAYDKNLVDLRAKIQEAKKSREGISQNQPLETSTAGE
jgi:hypothetical protein